jgi:hypothetical protein
MVSFRFGRKEVEDPVVNLLPPIDGGFEAGVFAGWHHIRTSGIPYRLRLGVSPHYGGLRRRDRRPCHALCQLVDSPQPHAVCASITCGPR